MKLAYSTWEGVEETDHSYDEVHTPARPYCDTQGCWCHTDAGYHVFVTSPSDDDALLEYAMATLGGKR